ncbi:MAG: hypothetical protein ACLQGU_20860 [bacterium]
MFALDVLQPLREIGFRVLRVEWLREVARDVVPEVSVSTGCLPGVCFQKVGKGFPGSHHPMRVRVYLPWRSGLHLDEKGAETVNLCSQILKRLGR